MNTLCPNCDLEAEVMAFLPAGQDIPTCESCGCPIQGFSYTLCSSCQVRYRSDLAECPLCGESDTGKHSEG